MKTKLQCAILLAGCLSGTTLACDEDGTALRYLGAIDAMDWDAMQFLLADDAWYTDPTMIYYDRPAIDIRGADGIVGFWRSSSEVSGTSNIAYTVTQCFETADYHMVNLDIHITVAGSFWNVNKDEIVMPGKVISVIRVDEGKVIEHHDYVDYAGGDTFIEELQKQYGPAKAED